MIAFASTGASGQERKTYSWVDEDGNLHYGDKVPAKFAEHDKRVLNEQAVVVEEVQGRKSEEEIAAEKAEEARIAAVELQRREDRALLATYLTVDEIYMHRDRRVELFQAQARVTEMYLKNLERRLDKLMSEAGRFQPYNEDPDAPMVDPDLIEEIDFTKETIQRHQGNLKKFASDEQSIIQRFDQQIERFEYLKGLTANAG